MRNSILGKLMASIFGGFGALTLVTGLLVSETTEAREVRYKEVSFDVKPEERLVVSGFRGSLRLTPASGNTAVVRVRKTQSDKIGSAASFEKWTFLVRRDENIIRLEVTGPDAKADWAAQLAEGFPEFHMELAFPSLPADIQWREGSVTAQNWRNNLAVSLIEGQVRTQGTEGALRLQVLKGETRVDQHKGRLAVDSYQSRLTLQQIEGDVLVENFQGESVLTNARGNLQWKTRQGSSTLSKVSGSLDFEMGRGSLNLNGFEGPLRGQMDEGNVSAQLLGDPDVNIEAEGGNVNLKLPAQAGGVVRLVTEEGNLYAPDYLKPNRQPTQTSIYGRLRGTGKGTVAVKTRTGSVRLR